AAVTAGASPEPGNWASGVPSPVSAKRWSRSLLSASPTQTLPRLILPVSGMATGSGNVQRIASGDPRPGLIRPAVVSTSNVPSGVVTTRVARPACCAKAIDTDPATATTHTNLPRRLMAFPPDQEQHQEQRDPPPRERATYRASRSDARELPARPSAECRSPPISRCRP